MLLRYYNVMVLSLKNFFMALKLFVTFTVGFLILIIQILSSAL